MHNLKKQIKEEIREIRKQFGLKESTIYQILWNVAIPVLRGKFKTLNIYATRKIQN